MTAFSGRPALEHIAPARLLSCLAFALILAGCSRGQNDDTTAAAPEALEAVAGSVTYHERISLSEAATVEVELLDVSVDGPAAVISTQRIRNPGPVPVHFRLDYPVERIEPEHRYTVQARIYDGDTLAYATDTPYPVITQGNPRTVEIAVVAIGSTGQSVAAATAEPPLEGTLSADGIESHYTAQFADGRLVSIQEERRQGGRGEAGAEYQFKDGRLLRYVELGRWSDVAGPGVLKSVELDFAFDDTGELLAARKTVDNLPAQPTTAEIDVVRNRAELLRSHALARQAARQHGQ